MDICSTSTRAKLPLDAHTFTGEQTDATTGLEYLRARYYDSATGRFLSLDPKGGRYRYAGNNPTNMIDPSGLYAICGYNEEWAGEICFDSTEVGLPAEEATYCDVANNWCVWEETGFRSAYYGGSSANAGATADCGTCGAQGSSGGGGGCGVFSVVCNAASDAFDAVTDQPLAWAANAVGVADLVPLEEFGPWGMVAEAVIDIAAAGVWQVQIELSDCDAATKNYLTGLNLDNGVIGTINAANPVPNPAAMAAEGGLYVTTSAVLSKC